LAAARYVFDDDLMPGSTPRNHGSTALRCAADAAMSADHVIGVDWGSSNRRAYLVSAQGRLLGRREDAAGVLSAGPLDHRASLMEFVGDWWRDCGASIWLSGMIGGRDGWREIPYLQAPLALDELCGRAGMVSEGGAKQPVINILPGVCQKPPTGPADVMRGEETQLLGAWSRTGRSAWYVLPGTHSKWVRIEDGRIRRFHTFMTGELYARLREKGALASLTAGNVDCDAGFNAGLLRARETPLPAALFGIRAGALLGEFEPAQAASRLSGSLIGSEWETARQLGCLDGGSVFLLGAAGVVRWYQQAAQHYGVEAQVLDADDCYVQALLQCLQQA
jgi:2-dehydro-3-deoxygalactonokinase